MKIYIEIIIIINSLLDFNILYITNMVLKRNAKITKLILGTIVGNLSLIFLILNLSSIELFIIKIILALLICLITFNYRNTKYTLNNIIYFYMLSTIYGGVLFYLKNIFKNAYIYIFISILLIPIIAKFLIIKLNKRSSNYNYYYLIKIILKDNFEITLNSFLDTGNKLIDPYTNKGIILVDKNKISDIHIRSPIYVPFKSLNNTGLIKCIKPVCIEIENQKFTNYLIGLSDNSFNIDGIECLLNYKLLEELNV